MLIGTGDPARLADGAARIEAFDAAPLAFPGVEVLRAFFEIARAGIETYFPPALQASLPPLVCFEVWRCASGPLGPFQLAQVRLTCRSGLRGRLLLIGSACDSPRAGEALRAGWAFAPRSGSIELQRGYDRIDARVALAGSTALELSLLDPLPLGTGDIQFMSNVHPAQTPRGLRLLQVDPEYACARNERGRAVLRAFDAAAWGEPRIRVTLPLAATFSQADVTLGPLRFASRPELSAFVGSEALT